MHRPARAFSSTAALALLLALPAAAQPAPEPSAPLPSPSASSTDPAPAPAAADAQTPPRAASSPAHELFLEAERRYDAGDFAGALSLLRQSYDLAAPELRIGLLFSLAQAYRQLDRCEEARDLYAEYLTSSRAKSPAVSQRRDDARYYFEQLSAACPASSAPASVPSSSAALAPPALAPAAPHAPPPGAVDRAGLAPNQIVAWSLFGVGGAAAVGSTIFALAALRAEDDVEHLAQPGVSYDDVVRPREDDGRLYQKYAWILAGGAVFCGSVGAALLLLDGDSKPEPPPVAVNVDPTGGFVGLDYRGTF
jgi:hypothetical protein